MEKASCWRGKASERLGAKGHKWDPGHLVRISRSSPYMWGPFCTSLS